MVIIVIQQKYISHYLKRRSGEMKDTIIRLLSLVIVVFVLGFSCSENQREIKSKQLQQRGNELYYAVNEEKPYSGKVVEYYESGQKKKERTFKNGKLHGLSTNWDSKGQKETEVSYQNGVQSGPYRTWYENGQQEKEGAYKDGKEDGQWVFWYANGQKQREGEYNDGKREGMWGFWTQDGRKLDVDVVTDIDGNTYLTIRIGKQWWMAENLKVTHYLNGDAIPNVTGGKAWVNLITGAYCSYDNDAANAKAYGLLYNCYAVMDARGLAPKGWHVPSDEEWQILVDYFGHNEDAGSKMKETGIIYWNSPNTGATNESGFSALPGGYRSNYGNFSSVGTTALFWSSTKGSRGNAWYRYLGYSYSGIYRDGYNKGNGFSVRCVQD
jgi:uncharacterized protein (TIGR02145 family)